MDLLGQSALILAVTSFSLAVTVLTRNFRNRLGQAFAALCTVVWGWAFFFFLEKIFATGTFYLLHLTCNLLLAPVALYFVRTFTRVENATSQVILNAALFYSIPLIPLQWTQWADRPVVRLLTFFAPIFMGMECAHLMYLDFKIQRGGTGGRKPQILSTVGLTRRSWIYLGAIFVLCSCFMDHTTLLGDVVPSLGNVFFCLYLFLISEAVTQQRLLNVGALLNRILVLVFLSLCLTVIYTLLVAWIQNSAGLFILNTFLASFIILMLIEPIKKLTSVGVMQLFYSQYLKLEERVYEGQKQLTGMLDTVGLAQLSLNFLEATLKFESATVFVLRPDGAKYRRLRGLRDDRLETREILATHPVVEFFSRMKRRGETPVILDTYLENEIDRTTSLLLRQNFEMILQSLKSLNSNILIPFFAEGTVLGFVAVNSPTPPEPWGNNWGILSVVYPFFQQSARILKNMDIYVRLREKDRLAALGEMSAGLAHEIRNPLGAIKGAAQLLEKSRSFSSVEEPFVKVIVEEVNRLNKVVTQFLDYSRPLTSEFVEYEVNALIEKTLDLMRIEGHRGIVFRNQTPEGGYSALPKIRCNPEQLKQVLVNLLHNAANAIKSKAQTFPSLQGVVQIGAYAEVNSRGQRELVVYVEDNGSGIPKENLDKIFIPFFTTSPAGTGLGLPICSRIIEAHGGRIDINSEEGSFTRFSIYFPILKG